MLSSLHSWRMSHSYLTACYLWLLIRAYRTESVCGHKTSTVHAHTASDVDYWEQLVRQCQTILMLFRIHSFSKPYHYSSLVIPMMKHCHFKSMEFKDNNDPFYPEKFKIYSISMHHLFSFSFPSVIVDLQFVCAHWRSMPAIHVKATQRVSAEQFVRLISECSW